MNLKEFKEKLWRRKLPKEFRNCTEEEMQERGRLMREEFARLKETDYTDDELIEFVQRHENLMIALGVIGRRELEERVWNSGF